MEHKKFSKIQTLKNCKMSITQKLHGTNAQIYIFEYTSTGSESHEPRMQAKAGSRNRWIFPGDDNYGFASYVEENKQEIIDILGPGLHYGEWCGPGINSGEGLKEKTLFLFNWRRWESVTLPTGILTVPVLYEGDMDMSKVPEVMDKLLKEGSKAVPGFNKPEGVVVEVLGQLFKQTFAVEESAWKGSKSGNKNKPKKEIIDYSYLCQPIRLEKIISSDEAYTREYPKSLPVICKAYMADLEEEGQILGDEDERSSIRKRASSQIFQFIRSQMRC